jgi:hypothetical protein
MNQVPGGVMVIVNLENLLNEVSPQVTPFSLAEICTIRTHFVVPVQQPDWSIVQSRDGSSSHCKS